MSDILILDYSTLVQPLHSTYLHFISRFFAFHARFYVMSVLYYLSHSEISAVSIQPIFIGGADEIPETPKYLQDESE